MKHPRMEEVGIIKAGPGEIGVFVLRRGGWRFNVISGRGNGGFAEPK